MNLGTRSQRKSFLIFFYSVASVVAVGRTSCLYLSKAAFREALSTQQFHMMMQVSPIHFEALDIARMLHMNEL